MYDSFGMTRKVPKGGIAEQRGPINGLIVDKMREKNLGTLRDFADFAGVGRATMYELVRGRSNSSSPTRPSLETLDKLAVVLDMPMYKLLYMVSPDSPGADHVLGSEMLRVHLVGHVGAGRQQMQEIDGDSVYIERAFAQGRELVAFRVRGDSMAGGKHPIYDDDVVIIDRHLGGEINSPVVARLRDDGHVVKRLRAGGYLDSSNTAFDDPELSIIQPDRVAQILGPVVRVISNLV
jgi:SOS-response transcriptional repressor LexA